MKALIIFLVGLVVGGINAVAGGASSLSFPVLVALGLNPVVATATNSIAVWATNPFALIAQRRRVKSAFRSVGPLIISASIGTIIGAVALILFPVDLFEKFVPFLLLIATGTMLIPVRSAKRRFTDRAEWWSIFGSGIYNGYFGPGQGVMVIAALMRSREYKDVNIGKTIIVGICSFFSAAIYLFAGVVSWTFMAPLAIGCAIGGWGAGYLVGKIDIRIFRALVIAIGFAASLWLFKKYLLA